MGCRKRAAPDALVRVVRRPDGTLDVGRGLPGRGAWLCAGSDACVERAVRRGGLERALRGALDASALEDLRRRLAGNARAVPAPGGSDVCPGAERTPSCARMVSPAVRSAPAHPERR